MKSRWSGIFRLLRNRSLSQQIFLGMLAITLVAVLLSAVVLYDSSTKEAVRTNTLIGERNLNAAKENVEQLLRSAKDAATAIFFDREMQNGILREKTALPELAIYNNLSAQLSRAMNVAPAIARLSVYAKDGLSLSTVRVTNPYYDDYDSCRSHFTEAGLGEAFENSSDYWYAPEENRGLEGSSMRCFVNLRQLRSLDTGNPVALLLVYIDERTVSGLYAFFGEGSFIMSRDGTVLSSVDKDRLGENLAGTLLYQSILDAGKSAGSLSWREEGKTRWASSVYLPELSAYLVAVPDGDPLRSSRASILATAGLLILLGLLFSLMAAALFSRGVTRQLIRLKETMAAARSGNLSVRFPAGVGSPEISFLGGAFNSMLADIERYIREIRASESLKREGELRLLQAQINPHLLYNTLDSAKWLLQKGNADTAASVMESLSGFFKISLAKGEMYVTMETELAHIRHYAMIQRLCRGKEITLRIRGERPFLSQRIVKMTFQPIVENAFLHAFWGSGGDGALSIDFCPSEGGDTLFIHFTDDGVGMTPPELDRLRESLVSRQDAGGGFGLWNVNRRLATCYGPEFGLSVDSEFGEYTRVTVSVPIGKECSHVPPDDH